MSEFLKSYLQNIPGFSNEFDENKYCCNGCFYASEKYMKDNFIADSVDYIQDQIESIKNTFTKHPSINNPGLNNSVLLCCRAFLYHQPVLLSNVYETFLQHATSENKDDLSQRWLLQITFYYI